LVILRNYIGSGSSGNVHERLVLSFDMVV
jgi:hypothetical protein